MEVKTTTYFDPEKNNLLLFKRPYYQSLTTRKNNHIDKSYYKPLLVITVYGYLLLKQCHLELTCIDSDMITIITLIILRNEGWYKRGLFLSPFILKHILQSSSLNVKFQ